MSAAGQRRFERHGQSIMKNIAVIGYGVVGKGTVSLIDRNAAVIEKKLGDRLCVKYIVDLRDFPGDPNSGKLVKDFSRVLEDPDVSIVAELIGGCRAAFDFSMAAMAAGKSVVTSNKEVVAEKGTELLAQAEKYGVSYLFEASVGGGIPILRPLTEDLAANEIDRIDGILNGTTNYILTQMFSEGRSFADALRDAQKKGYAEADPTADVEGLDSCRKICILSAIAYGKSIKPALVHTEGISSIRPEDVMTAERSGYSVKLIGSTGKCADGKVFAAVRPMLVPKSNPLSHIDDVFNGIMVKGDFTGDVMFYGKGAGAMPTASAVVSDIICAASAGGHSAVPLRFEKAEDGDLCSYENTESPEYIAFAGSPATAAKYFGVITLLPGDGPETRFITEPKKHSAISAAAAAAQKAGHPCSARLAVLE